MKGISLGAKLMLAVLLAGLLGCSSTKSVPEEIPLSPPPKEPEPIPVAPNTESIWLETLDERPTQRVLVGDNTPILFQLVSGEGYLWNQGEVVPLGSAASSILTSATSIALAGTGELLISHAEGLSVLVEDEILPSPLNGLAQWSGISDMMTIEDSGQSFLWVATSQGLWRWSSGQLQSVMVADFSTLSAKFAWGPAIRHGPAMWVVAENDFYALDSTTAGWSAWEGFKECVAQDIGVNQEGGLWLQCEQALRYRSPDGIWHEAPMEAPVVGMHTHAQSSSSWLQTADDRLWHAHDDQLWPVELEVPTGGLAVDSTGGLLMATDNGLMRASPGRSIVFENMPSDGVLVTKRDVTLALEGADVITEVSASLDGTVLELSGENWLFTLDGPGLEEGEHLIEISVSYSDTEQISTSKAYFTVLHPSWERDIRPISEYYCKSCHGTEGAVSLKLHTYSQWNSNAEDILAAVEGALMPPGVPLDGEPLALIRYWNEASLPE